MSNRLPESVPVCVQREDHDDKFAIMGSQSRVVRERPFGGRHLCCHESHLVPAHTVDTVRMAWRTTLNVIMVLCIVVATHASQRFVISFLAIFLFFVDGFLLTGSHVLALLSLTRTHTHTYTSVSPYLISLSSLSLSPSLSLSLSLPRLSSLCTVHAFFALLHAYIFGWSPPPF